MAGTGEYLSQTRLPPSLVFLSSKFFLTKSFIYFDKRVYLKGLVVLGKNEKGGGIRCKEDCSGSGCVSAKGEKGTLRKGKVCAFYGERGWRWMSQEVGGGEVKREVVSFLCCRVVESLWWDWQ